MFFHKMCYTATAIRMFLHFSNKTHHLTNYLIMHHIWSMTKDAVTNRSNHQLIKNYFDQFLHFLYMLVHLNYLLVAEARIVW